MTYGKFHINGESTMSSPALSGLPVTAGVTSANGNDGGLSSLRRALKQERATVVRDCRLRRAKSFCAQDRDAHCAFPSIVFVPPYSLHLLPRSDRPTLSILLLFCRESKLISPFDRFYVIKPPCGQCRAKPWTQPKGLPAGRPSNIAETAKGSDGLRLQAQESAFSVDFNKCGSPVLGIARSLWVHASDFLWM